MQTAQGQGSDGSITVYSSPACPHCRRLQSYLDELGIEYVKRDVSESAAARFELKRLTDRLAIPVTRIGDTVISGFDVEQLRKVLGIDKKTQAEQETVASVLPRLEGTALQEALRAAKGVLEANRSGNKTRASRHLYPHQWNWDSGFIAHGYLHYDPALAYGEIRSLFEGQWSDGFLPHIVFNPDFLNHFPGPDYWKAERSGRVPSNVHTSGISQPPVHASMLVDAARLDPDRQRALSFLSEIYPRLKRLHDFFFTQRDPHRENLVTLVHPWESGIDNAPTWDEPLATIVESSPWAGAMRQQYDAEAEKGNRPKRDYIEKYSFLVESLFTRDFDWDEIGRTHPFLIQDVLFNSILCQSERDLGTIAAQIGEDSDRHFARADRMAAAMNRKLWSDSDGVYYSYDLIAQRLIPRDTIFSYMPMYARTCDEARGRRLMENLLTHCFCVADHNCVGIPTYDMCQADYEGEFYWRGPVWYNMCWYMVRAFRNYSAAEQAEWLERSLQRLVIDQGFYEYYEPETGKGLGADDFSWTAALFIDLAAGHEH